MGRECRGQSREEFSAEQFGRLDCEPRFQSKKGNNVGGGQADLALHCPSLMLTPLQPNRAFDIARRSHWAAEEPSGNTQMDASCLRQRMFASREFSVREDYRPNGPGLSLTRQPICY